MKMNKNTINTGLLKDAGNAMKVQQHQLFSAEEQMQQIKAASDKLSDINNQNLDDLDLLLAQAESLCSKVGVDNSSLTEEDYNNGVELSETMHVKTVESTVEINETKVVKCGEDASQEQYMENVGAYAKDHSLNLVSDPFATLLSQPQHDELIARVRQDYYAKKPEFDKYDYIIASFCGVVAGLIDSFFVGMPGKSKLGKWTNKETDEIVIKLAKLKGWKSNSGNDGNIGHAISYFEKEYPVNYEQATSSSVGNKFEMSYSNHHIKSLSHAPDIFGLMFSIIDQFCSKSHFINNGRLIVVKEEYELQGKNFFAKLFCGFCNWLGHIVSDIAGSSTGRKANINLSGSGVSIPFFELLQGINIEAINIGDEKKTIADAAVKMFEEGYDARFGFAMSIPVAFNEFSVRLSWMIKQHYYHKQPWKKCIPIICIREFKDAESNAVVLRRMILASYGCLCLVDLGDAVIRSGGQIASMNFLLHINIMAWKKLAVNLALTGIMEIRLNYNTKHINVNKLDKDLQDEWDLLYKQM